MKSLAELEAIKNKAKSDMSARSEAGKRIVVGMATCGIAAGARPVMTAIVEELKTRGIEDVAVTMTGCIGLCKYEPIVPRLPISRWIRTRQSVWLPSTS